MGIRALLSVNTADLPRVGTDGALVAPDWRILLFTAAAALLTGVLFGLIPAVQASRPDWAESLKEGGARAGFRHNKARSTLVVGEVALAVVLLVGAALLIRTSLALAAVNPGFDGAHVLTMNMSLEGGQYARSAAVERLVHDGVQRLSALPGVTLASATCCVPLEGGYGLPFLIMGRPLTNGPFHGGGEWRTVSPGYFEVFRIPVLRGRDFTERDDAAGEPVVVISQSMARQSWPKGDPLNDRIWIGHGIMSEFSTEPPRRIVGIVGDVRNSGLDQNPGNVMYLPNAQVPDAVTALNNRIRPMSWIVRTRGNPRALSAAVQAQLRELTGLPVSDIGAMDEVVARSTSRQRFNMLLMTVFGAAALFLAAIGVYGLMAHSVEQRTREIGIRMALGAGTRDVRRMVLLQGMRLALVGVALGVAAAFGLTRVMSAFLYGVKERDLLVFVTVPAALAAVSLVAVWLPAARATRIDPAIALRWE